MYLLILRLLIRTRLTKGFLVFLILVAFADISISFSGISPDRSAQTLSGLYVIAFIYYFILTMIIFFGNGLGMTKPDADFLLPSSVKGKTLNIALFSVQLISLSLIFIILSVAYSFELYHISLLAALYILDFLMLGIILASMSVIVSDFDLMYRAPVFAVVSLFLFSFLLRFAYSPFSILTGNLVQSTMGTLALFIVTTFFAVRWILTNDIYFKPPRTAFRKRETFKDRMTFVGLNPARAMFRHYFYHFYSGRPIGMSGTVLSVTNRYRLKGVLAVIAGISAIAGFAILYSKLPNVNDLYPVLITLIIYLTFVANMGLYSTTFSVERLWLSALSMPFHTYVRRMVLTQMVQSMVLEIPLAVVIAILGLIYGKGLFPLLLAVLILTPEAVAIMSSLSIVSAQPQAWENAIMVRRVGLKRAIYLLPYSGIMLSGVLMSILNPIAAAMEAAVIGLVIYFIVTRRKYWEGMMSKLTEKNYI